MPGLFPGIHVLGAARKVVDGRDKPGHDDVEMPVAKRTDGISVQEIDGFR
jgi:hypothetical protein